MKTGANTSEWYLVLGSGPTALDGTSTQEAKTAVFSLKELTASPRAAIQIPDTVSTVGNETGCFFHALDKTDAGSNAQEAYYGIKEPQNCNGDMTWAPVKKSPATPSTALGDRGFLRVDQILVQESSATLSCIGGGDACLPEEVAGTKIGTFNQLVNHIVGTGCDEGVPTGMDGWYKEFPADRERNLGQATLLGGLLTFTTYQPFVDVCLPEGMAFLYGSYYQTGTAWHERVFAPSGIDIDADGNVIDRLSIGRGLAMTPNLHVGKHAGSKAFVQTSTGAIVEIPQPNLPIKNAKSGLTVWDEIIK